MPPPYAIRVKTATGWQDIAIQGATGDPGAVEVYEQPDEPLDIDIGAIWIDTDAPTPEPGVGPTGPEGPKGDPGAPLPPGGTTGQALVKKTNADQDTEWGVAGAPPEVLVGPSQPSGTEVIWVDTDEPSWAGPPILVTALPTSPFDGMEILYRFVPTTTPATTIPLLWHLRWDAANAAWLPVGEQRPILAYYYPGASTSMGSGAWGTYDANDPRLYVPLAGTYECESGASETYGGVAVNLEIGMGKNGTVWAAGGASSATAGWPYTTRVKDINTFAVNDLIRQFYYLSTAGPQNVVFRGRFIQIKPMRIT